ncbi:LLM class flavin-dependent oxidoreductase [Listeria innocua]|uniref:LLM class flavin-dependent oxidoreductase n=1 Tax=Listeria innocua TaxID=1642 RepID=UPI0010F3DF3B|nr:LLM class flavin-dependent oxidoreductase [Listeria innocua]EAD5705339.1 LLM class flavin-dependent oxidoreductase [Listeria innocua]EAD5753991.1 LLM class flavin-dependent oxidoreductase [Listeria innocua]EBB6231540.1 LLM class flavin-dependent oxidoreductase [Listeria innocua]EFO6643451.1 LLM class flavin-dependent oxidoreductase [Listeria innocua]EFV4188528.1 LLM class flavin-dependent oxidoreductase [Listeria innocua]
MTIRLSILDQSIINPGERPSEALQNTVELAELAEQLGFYRFWVAEHHNSDEIAGAAPEVLLGYIAAKTTTIKLASGGVMLQHYSPYKVAEQFHVLENLAPGRISLGVGKAPGGFQPATDALQKDFAKSIQTFDAKLIELVDFVTRKSASKVEAKPLPENNPEIFLLGGSVASARQAAELGISFVFAYFINGEEEVLKEARDTFEQYQINQQASFQLAPIVVVAETKAAADRQIPERESIKVELSDGRRVNVGSREQAEAYVKDISQPYRFITQKIGAITGTKQDVGEEITRLSKKYNIQDFVVLTPVKSAEIKRYSYQLLSESIKEEVVHG